MGEELITSSKVPPDLLQLEIRTLVEIGLHTVIYILQLKRKTNYTEKNTLLVVARHKITSS